MDWRAYITIDPEVAGGTPFLTRTRIPVALVLRYLAEGHDAASIRVHFPRIWEFDIKACIDYDNDRQGRPTLNEYLQKVIAAFEPYDLRLTNKARECLIRGAAAARAQESYLHDDSLMRGFIEARSAAIPVLDSAGVPFRRFLKDLKSNPSGQGDVLDPFRAEFDNIRGGQAFQVLQWASAIAESRDHHVIDSATLFEGLLRQSLDPNLYSPEDIRRVARRSLSEQLRSIISSGQSDTDNWRYLPLPTLLATLEANQDIEFVSPLLERLADHVTDWSVIERIEDRLAFAKNVEPYLDEPRHVIIPTPRGWRLRQFDYFNSYLLSEEQKLSPAKISTFTGRGILTWRDIEEFEHLLDKTNTNEEDFQNFFDLHPGFVLGGEYARLHSKVALLDDSGNKLVPDFFAERIGSRFADIIEIKKPTARLVAGTLKRRGFSAALTQALNQAREYRNFFDDARNRTRFHKKYGFEAFRPRLCVIIGRNSDYKSHIERIQIEDEYKNLRVQTFDDILARAKQMAVID